MENVSRGNVVSTLVSTVYLGRVSHKRVAVRLREG